MALFKLRTYLSPFSRRCLRSLNRKHVCCLSSFPLIVLTCLSVGSFVALSALENAFPQNSFYILTSRTKPRTLMRQLIYTNHAYDSEGRILSPNLFDKEDKKTAAGNSTELPGDCFHGLLRSVDPNCDLGMFCTEAWREEDVLCHVYLHQSALLPSHEQCWLPDTILDDGDNDSEDDTFEVKDEVPRRVNNEFHERPEKEEFHEEDVDAFRKKFQDELHQKVKVKVGPGRKVSGVKVVPRLAYYVLVSESCGRPFRFLFLHYLSVVSVRRFLRPRAIYVLANCVPSGYWWSRLVNTVKGVRFVHRPRPQITKDGAVKWISHLADVIRLQVLLVNGGVYVDTDMLLLRPLDPLLSYPLTMGLVDNNTGMGNALILATRGSRFLKDWYQGYKDFRPLNFHYNGMWAAMRLWREDPSRVHMESRRFYSPNWYEAERLFRDADFDLSDSYAVHVWHRHAPVPSGPESIMDLNTTLGKVMRRIYLGQ